MIPKSPARKMMPIILIILAGIFVLIGIVVVIRTYTYPFREHPDSDGEFFPADTSSLPVTRLSGGLKIATISSAIYEETNFEPFDQFKAYLPAAYPDIYARMETYTVNDYGLVFKWKGKNQTLNPVLFLSHYDVVPPGDDPDGPEGWDYPPFSGTVMNGKICGRGTLDMKGMLFALLEAAEELILRGFIPERDYYFAFGHDEEVGGLNGARKIALDFEQKGLRFDAVFDEGGIVASKGFIGPLNKDVALVGVAEKGYLTLNISVKGPGGHSSTPPSNSALGQAAVIMQRLEQNQMKPRLIQPIRDLLDNIGNAMDFPTRMAIANQWLFRPLLINSLSKEQASNALVRTTTALTMARGSDTDNVLPYTAQIVINFRLLPGDKVEDVIRHVEDQCRGFDVEIKTIAAREASRISPAKTKSFEKIRYAVSRTFPGAICTPYISITGSDARKYEGLSDHIYRLIPVKLTSEEQQTIHNFNECISLDNYRRMIACFKEIMINYE